MTDIERGPSVLSPEVIGVRRETSLSVRVAADFAEGIVGVNRKPGARPDRRAYNKHVLLVEPARLVFVYVVQGPKRPDAAARYRRIERAWKRRVYVSRPKDVQAARVEICCGYIEVVWKALFDA